MRVSILSKRVSTEELGGTSTCASPGVAGDGAAAGGTFAGARDVWRLLQNTHSLHGTIGPAGVKE